MNIYMKYIFPMTMISMIFIILVILVISIYTTYHRNTKREYFIYNIGKNNNDNKKHINNHDSNKDNRNVSEGTLSYHKRLFTKYIHRPTKLTIRNITNNIKNQLLSFKRKYL